MKLNYILLISILFFSQCIKERLNPYDNLGTGPGLCTFVYSSWSFCSNNIQTRTYASSPSGCSGTPPADSIQRSCVMGLFTENFTSTWAAATQGWVVINNSLPVGTKTVFQGNGAGVFPAFNGAANDYVGMNFNSCSGAGGISTWLITPTLNISNGLVFEFATRTTAPIQFADRLQLRMSPVDNVAIPSGTTSVGTYTTLMLDINPNLGVNNSSVVVGNSVNGYPDAWAVYTVTVSGLAGPTIGRFALRYFVADGGPSGNESNYIGIDAVKISNP